MSADVVMGLFGLVAIFLSGGALGYVIGKDREATRQHAERLADSDYYRRLIRGH